MPKLTQGKKYPLHIHISSLFTILILVVSVTLAWVSYRQISNLAFETTEILFTKTTKQPKFCLPKPPMNYGFGSRRNIDQSPHLFACSPVPP